MALPQRQLANAPPLGATSDANTGRIVSGGRVIPWTPPIINTGPVQTGNTGNNSDGTISTPAQGKLIPFPMQGGRQGMVPQIQRPPNVPDGHKLMWVNPTLANDLQQHFSKTNATAVVPHADVRSGNVASGHTGGLHPEGPANNAAPLPVATAAGSNPGLEPIDFPPATGGNPPTTAPFPTTNPGGPTVEVPTGPHDQPLPVTGTPIGTDPNAGRDNTGDDGDGGRFGPDGQSTDPDAPDRFGGSGGNGGGGRPANGGDIYALLSSLGYSLGPFSEGSTSVAGAGGWKYLTHKPALLA